MTPAAASDAASTADAAARPELNCFTDPPPRLASSEPADMVTAMPMAWAAPCASRPITRAAAATVPQIAEASLAAEQEPRGPRPRIAPAAAERRRTETAA